MWHLEVTRGEVYTHYDCETPAVSQSVTLPVNQAVVSYMMS